MLRRLRPIFESFQKHDVRYVVFGGIAVALHGVPRATFDLDILVEPTAENCRKLLKALEACGFGTATQVTAEEIATTQITRLKDRILLDIMTSSPGLTFDEAWRNRVQMEFEGQGFYVVSRDDLIRAKRAAGRPRDLEDLRALDSGD